MSPSPILSPSDEAEEHLLTQPDAEADKAEADKAEAIDSDEEEERLLTQPDEAIWAWQSVHFHPPLLF